MEPTPDMLPDVQPEVPPAPVETVSEDVKPPVSEEPGPVESPEAAETPPPGFIPYARFKEVNTELKEAKEQLKALQDSAPEEERDLPQVENLEREVKELKMDKYLTQFPELNEKREELDDFLEENSGLSLDRAVNLFRVENGLYAVPSRKGLETTVAGPKTDPTPKWTIEAIDQLRNTDEKQWQKRMSAGEFDETLKKW